MQLWPWTVLAIYSFGHKHLWPYTALAIYNSGHIQLLPHTTGTKVNDWLQSTNNAPRILWPMSQWPWPYALWTRSNQGHIIAISSWQRQNHNYMYLYWLIAPLNCAKWLLVLIGSSNKCHWEMFSTDYLLIVSYLFIYLFCPTYLFINFVPFICLFCLLLFIINYLSCPIYAFILSYFDLFSIIYSFILSYFICVIPFIYLFCPTLFTLFYSLIIYLFIYLCLSILSYQGL